MESGNLYGLLTVIKTTLNYIIPILITLALIYFISGVIKFVISQNEEERKNSRDHIINGIIGIFVIVAAWTLVRFVGTTLGVDVDNNREGDVPQLK